MSFNNPIEISPQKIANKLFSEDPKEPLSQIISLDNNDNIDASLIFEMMITIFMEGLETIFDDLKKANLTLVNKNLLMKLNPWFWSMGFSLSIDNVNKNDKDKYDTNNRYCKIIINNDDYGFIFKLNNIDKSYHFLINKDYVHGCDINNVEQLFADFHIKNEVYKIGFTFYK